MGDGAMLARPADARLLPDIAILASVRPPRPLGPITTPPSSPPALKMPEWPALPGYIYSLALSSRLGDRDRIDACLCILARGDGPADGPRRGDSFVPIRRLIGDTAIAARRDYFRFSRAATLLLPTFHFIAACLAHSYCREVRDASLSFVISRVAAGELRTGVPYLRFTILASRYRRDYFPAHVVIARPPIRI